MQSSQSRTVTRLRDSGSSSLKAGRSHSAVWLTGEGSLGESLHLRELGFLLCESKIKCGGSLPHLPSQRHKGTLAPLMSSQIHPGLQLKVSSSSAPWED